MVGVMFACLRPRGLWCWKQGLLCLAEEVQPFLVVLSLVCLVSNVEQFARHSPNKEQQGCLSSCPLLGENDIDSSNYWFWENAQVFMTSSIAGLGGCINWYVFATLMIFASPHHFSQASNPARTPSIRAFRKESFRKNGFLCVDRVPFGDFL